MSKLSKRTARRIGVSIVGFPLIILGIVLIPLPGPGLLIVAAGLFVLSLEFDWAKKYLDQAKVYLKKMINQSRRNKNT